MTERENFLKYLDFQPDSLLYARGVKLQELAELKQERAMLLGNERQAKLEAYFQTEGTQKDREMMAQKNAMHITLSIWEIEGKMEALQLEADFIQEVVTYSA